MGHVKGVDGMATLMDVRMLEAESTVSRFTWRAWMREGRLPVVRLGRRVFVARSDFERFLRAGRVEAREAQRQGPRPA